MAFITVAEFKRRYFPESDHPSLSTIRRQLVSGLLHGRKVGKRWFVDCMAFEAGGDRILAKVLSDVSRAT